MSTLNAIIIKVNLPSAELYMIMSQELNTGVWINHAITIVYRNIGENNN
jgi:hypothetical protein